MSHVFFLGGLSAISSVAKALNDMSARRDLIYDYKTDERLHKVYTRTHARTHARTHIHVLMYICMHVCIYISQWLRGRASDFQIREPGFEYCATVLKHWASFSLYIARDHSAV